MRGMRTIALEEAVHQYKKKGTIFICGVPDALLSSEPLIDSNVYSNGKYLGSNVPSPRGQVLAIGIEKEKASA